jgi:hypothetical protein
VRQRVLAVFVENFKDAIASCFRDKKHD